MNVQKIKEIIRRKPMFFLFVSLGFLILVGLLKWQLHPPIGAIWFLLGGIIGVYFLDAAEVFFALSPSPFRSVNFLGLFVIVSLFVNTSSGSLLAQGLVFSLYLSIILWQIGQWQLTGNLDDWYRMVAVPVTRPNQKLGLLLFIAIFIVEMLLFLAWA
jgi:hypothetical protein